MSASDKDQFLYPHESYRGDFSLENVAFNANLQEFAKKVNVICNLETNGKISTHQAYKDIKALWKQLKGTKKSLDIKPEE